MTTLLESTAVRRSYSPVRLPGLSAALRALFSFEMTLILFLLGTELLSFTDAEIEGSTCTAVFLAVSAVAAGCLTLRKQLTFAPNTLPFLLCYTAFVAYVAASYYYLSLGLPKADRKFLEFIVANSWCVFAGALFVNDRRRAARFVGLLLACGVLFALAAFYQVLQGSVYRSGMGAIGDSYQRLGRQTGATVLLCVGLLPFVRKGTDRRVLLGCLAVAIMGLLVSGHRAPLVVLPCLFLFLMFKSLARSKSLQLRYFVFIALFIGIVAAVAVFKSERVGRALDRWNYLNLDAGTDVGRLMLYDVSLREFLHRPWCGVGFGAFSDASGLWDYRHPHNMFLEIASELGVLGLVPFLLYMFLWRRHYRATEVKNDPLRLSLVLLYWYYLLNAMISGDITDNRVFLLIVAILTTTITSRRPTTTRAADLAREAGDAPPPHRRPLRKQQRCANLQRTYASGGK